MSFVCKLPDESRQRYEAIAAGWRADFEPEGYQETRLVDILIQNDWVLVSGPPVDALALPTRMATERAARGEGAAVVSKPECAGEAAQHSSAGAVGEVDVEDGVTKITLLASEIQLHRPSSAQY